MFFPTITIDNEIAKKLHDGTIHLRAGQWIKLEWCDRRARWIGRTPDGILIVQHYEGGYPREKFEALLSHWRGHFETKKPLAP